MAGGHGIISTDIIPARSGVAIKNTVSACGHGIMKRDGKTAARRKPYGIAKTKSGSALESNQ